MTNLEKSIYLACKAFCQHYEALGHLKQESAAPEPVSQENEPPEWVNEDAEPAQKKEFETCPRHGKLLKPGKYGPYCTSKEADPRYSNKNGYCNYKPGR